MQRMMTIAAATLLSLAGCNATPTTSMSSAGLTDGQYCFRQTTTGNGVTDVAELLITVSGASASGAYNWLPQEKDQRRGTFTGKVSGSRIAASYQFSQEGQTTTADIAITVSDTTATIEGGAPELGLAATLPKVGC